MFTQHKPTCDEDNDDLLNYMEEYSAPRRGERYLILQESKCKHPPFRPHGTPSGGMLFLCESGAV